MRTATERKDNPACTGRAEARRGRVLRRSVQHRDVKGVLACRNGRWAVDNESEVRMLAALGADGEGALDRFQALAETLNAGLVDASGLRRFNGRLTEMAAAPEEEVAIEWHAPDVMARAAFACVCLPPASHRNAPHWLAWALSARLEDNIVRGSFPGPGWLTLRSRHRYWGWGFNRDTCWIARLPAQFWARLRSHPCRWLRDAASASDPRTTPRALRRLARSDQAVVLDLVASHPNTPAAVLRHFGKNSVYREEVRLRVAQNKRTPPRLLGLMAGDVLSSVRLAVACHPSTPTAVVETLADDGSQHVRAAVARRADLGQRHLDRLARDCDEKVRCAVALNPSTRIPVVAALSKDRIAAVRTAAASSGWLKGYDLTRDRAMTVRRSVAYKDNVPPHLLARLAEDPKVDVRVAVAWNEATPPASLESLAQDPQSRVRSAAAMNPSTPLGSLRALARDSDRWVRRAVAHNASAPADLLSYVLESATPDIRNDVRRNVAANPAATAEMLRSLAARDDHCIQHGLARNPSAPEEVLDHLASLSDCYIREPVASNPATPSRTLAKLAADQDRRVRKAAAKNLHDRSRAKIEPAVAAARNSTDWPSTCLTALRSAIHRPRRRRNRRTPGEADTRLRGLASHS